MPNTKFLAKVYIGSLDALHGSQSWSNDNDLLADAFVNYANIKINEYINENPPIICDGRGKMIT
jgi:hypothetical protein